MIAVVEALVPRAMLRTWPADPITVAALLGAATLYVAGRRRGTVRGARDLAFAGGVAAVAAALLTPLDVAAEQLFSAHMVQHLLLLVVAPPLFVLARPLRTMSRAAPRSLRRPSRSVRLALDARAWARRAPVTFVLATVDLWSWHLPGPYQAALSDPAIHAVEHASFLVTGVLVWSVALDARKGGGLGGLGRALFLLACAIPSALLGAILLFTPVVLYPAHGAGSAAWGLTPLQDQELAGVLMWVPPSAVYLAAAVCMVTRWMRRMEGAASTCPVRLEGRAA